MNEMFGTPHDCTHVIWGYDTTPQGELLVSTFTSRMHPVFPMAGHVLPVIYSWHVGIEFNKLAGSYKGALDPASAIDIVVPGVTQVQHPRHFGWFPSNASLGSVLGDLAASGLGSLGITWQSAPALTEVETYFAAKYHDGAPFGHDGRHGWLRVTPTRITSWDFRKIPGHLREPAADA